MTAHRPRKPVPGPTTAPKRPRGRPPKGKREIVPEILLPAAGECLAEIARQAKARAAAHERLTPAEVKILREEWLRDQAQYLWPNLEAASADIGVSVSTLRTWRQDGCPGFPGDGDGNAPIPKHLVHAWRADRAALHGNAPATSQTSEDQDARWRRLRADALERRLTSEATAAAEQVVRDATTHLRTTLINQGPDHILTTIRKAMTEVGIVDQFGKVDEGTLQEDLTTTIETLFALAANTDRTTHQETPCPSPSTPSRLPETSPVTQN